MKQEKLPTWMSLEDEVNEMEKLDSLLFCMEAATEVEESGVTFPLSRLTPALKLAQDLLNASKSRIDGISNIERTFNHSSAKSTKDYIGEEVAMA